MLYPIAEWNLIRLISLSLVLSERRSNLRLLRLCHGGRARIGAVFPFKLASPRNSSFLRDFFDCLYRATGRIGNLRPLWRPPRTQSDTRRFIADHERADVDQFCCRATPKSVLGHVSALRFALRSRHRPRRRMGWSSAVSSRECAGLRRAWFGMCPRSSARIGFIAANGISFRSRGVARKRQFQRWGWRVPFVMSAVLVLVGFMCD